MAEKEYIERGALLQDIDETVLFSVKVESIRLETRGANKVIDRIKAQPTADVVDVVRCKDCKYYDEATVNEKGFLICPASGMEITEYDFCSYGEKKDKE